jgi:hypothetical protein
MKRLLMLSTLTFWGLDKFAFVAMPPSPENPLVPVPAMVVMMLLVPTFRTHWLPESTIYKLPVSSG